MWVIGIAFVVSLAPAEVSAQAGAQCSTVVTAGLEDEFGSPPDPAFPSETLAGLFSRPVGDFDLSAGVNGGTTNVDVAHTFTDLGEGVIEGARLRFRVRAGATGITRSDGLVLAFTGGGDEPPGSVLPSRLSGGECLEICVRPGDNPHAGRRSRCRGRSKRSQKSAEVERERRAEAMSFWMHC